jgi:hypothetical protein
MSLPPDPHEDDLSDPIAATPVPNPTPPPPPPPTTPAPGDRSPPSDIAPPPPAPAAPPGTADTGLPQTAASSAGSWPGEPAGAPAPTGPSRPGGKRRALLAAGAVAALVAVVGGVIVATGGDDEDETSTPASADAPADDEAESDGAGSDDDGSSDPAADDAPATPEAAAEALFAAARAGDCEAVIGLMAPEAFGPGDTPAEAVAECEADVEGRANLAELEIVDITLVSESGNDAVVAVTGTVDGETSTEELPLTRVDGAWMVASLG